MQTYAEQVESFGMHINVDGTVLQGIKMEAGMDGALKPQFV